MNSIRPEDRGKAAALVVGVIVVFVVIYMRLSSALGGTPQTAPGSPATVSISGTGGNGTVTPAVTTGTAVATNTPAGKKQDDQIEIPTLAPTQVEPDPFRPAPKTLEENKHGTTQSQTGGNQPFAEPPKNGGSAGQSLKGSIAEGGSDQNGPALPKVVGELQPDVVPMSLSGIVDGGSGKPIALITVGSHDYAVALGDTFGDGFRLEQAAGIKAIVSQHHILRTIAMPIPLIN